MGTVPQLDFSVYSSQIVWFACAFLLLYVAVRCLVVPRVESEIGARVKERDILLKQADCAYACVRDELFKQKVVLEDAEKRARDLVEGAVSEIAAVKEEAFRLLDFEVSCMMDAANEQLVVLEKSLHDELASFSNSVAAMYFARISGTKVSDVVED